MQNSPERLESVASLEVGRDSAQLCTLAKFFNGFANSTRLSILILLAQRGEMKVGDLVDELGAPQPRVSDHLRCLAWCGYVEARREGRNAYYSISDERVLDILDLGERIMRENAEQLEFCDAIRKRS